MATRVLSPLDPLPYESLSSLLARIGRANYYPEPRWYAPFLAPPVPGHPDLLSSAGHLEALAALTGVEPERLQGMTLYRFADLFAAPSAGSSRQAGVKTQSGRIPSQYASAESGKACPTCVWEGGALLLPWSLRIVTACPAHGLLLTAEPCPLDEVGTTLATLVWSAIGCGELYPPAAAGRRVREILDLMGAAGLLRFLTRMGDLLLHHDRDNPGFAPVGTLPRRVAGLDVVGAHAVLSTVADLLLDWTERWHRTLDRVADRDLPGVYGRPHLPLALAAAFRGAEWRWLHASWDAYVEGRARSAPTAGVYAWLCYYRIPRDGDDTPSLALLAPAQRDSPEAERRARLAEAPAYHPLPEPPWQLEGDPPVRATGGRPDVALSLRDAARLLGTTSAHVASLAAAGVLATESRPTSRGGGVWSFRGAVLTEFLACLPVRPIPERGIDHPVSLKQAMAVLSEVGVSLAQMVVAMKAGRLQQGRLTAFCAYPSPTLDRLWFSHLQVCEYLWYRREPIERKRLLPVDRLAKRYRMETLRLWYATGLLAP